jgi:hypothetical protein
LKHTPRLGKSAKSVFARHEMVERTLQEDRVDRRVGLLEPSGVTAFSGDV